MNICYKGQTMKVFHEAIVGRYRFYCAALPQHVEAIQTAWQKGNLGKPPFTVVLMPDQIIGEEVLDGQGRIIAVFGATLVNAFVPSTKIQQEYQQCLAKLIKTL